MIKGGTNEYVSPWQCYPVLHDEIGKILIANGDKKPHYPINVEHQLFCLRENVHSIIEGGYFHSFVGIPFGLEKLYTDHRTLMCSTRLIGAGYKWSYNNDSFIYTGKYRIVECTIPKNSLYWTGISGDICSDKLIFNRTLSEEEITKMLINQ